MFRRFRSQVSQIPSLKLILGALLEFACVTYVGDKDAATRKKNAAAAAKEKEELEKRLEAAEPPPPTEVKRRMPNLDEQSVSLRVRKFSPSFKLFCMEF